MAVIELKNVNMNVLKARAKEFNESGLLPEPLDTRVGIKKDALANAFVAGIEACNDLGKLDEVPEAVYNYYTEIVVPDADAGAGTADAGATPATGRGAAKKAAPAKKAAAAKKPAAKKAAAAKEPPKPKKATRAEAFAGVIMDGTPRTFEELDAVMNETYPGSQKETPFWNRAYGRLLIAMGLLTKGEDGKLTYAG